MSNTHSTFITYDQLLRVAGVAHRGGACPQVASKAVPCSITGVFRDAVMVRDIKPGFKRTGVHKDLGKIRSALKTYVWIKAGFGKLVTGQIHRLSSFEKGNDFQVRITKSIILSLRLHELQLVNAEFLSRARKYYKLRYDFVKDLKTRVKEFTAEQLSIQRRALIEQHIPLLKRKAKGAAEIVKQLAIAGTIDTAAYIGCSTVNGIDTLIGSLFGYYRRWSWLRDNGVYIPRPDGYPFIDPWYEKTREGNWIPITNWEKNKPSTSYVSNVLKSNFRWFRNESPPIPVGAVTIPAQDKLLQLAKIADSLAAPAKMCGECVKHGCICIVCMYDIARYRKWKRATLTPDLKPRKKRKTKQEQLNSKICALRPRLIRNAHARLKLLMASRKSS